MGFYLVITNVIYILFCMFISKFAIVLLKEHLSLKINKKALYIFLFMFFLLIPFWDLILQKGIKTYYQVFMSNPIIYEYPEKDKNGKWESLALGKIPKTSSSESLTKKENLNNLLNDYKVSNFLEIYILDSFKKEIIDNKEVIKRDYKKDIGYVRIYLNQDDIHYKLIKNENEFEARYQVLGEETDFYIFKKTDIKVWDKKKKKLLGEGSELKFGERDKDRFRYKFLFWRTGNDSDLVRIKSVDNYNKLFKELFETKLIKWKNIGE